MKLKPFIAGAIFVALSLDLSGCATSAALSYARGEYRAEQYRNDGKQVAPLKPHPAGYALVPLAAIVDIPTVPFIVLATIPVWLGLIPPQM